MRIYISVDMEGVTGLVDADDVQPDGRDYERGRSMMAEDVNAAVRGALAAGAADILVNDAHGPMRNLLPEALHPAVRLVRGKPKQMGMLEGLTGSTTPRCASATTPGPVRRACSATASWATRSRTCGWTVNRSARSGSPTPRRRPWGCRWWPSRVTTWRARR